MLTNSYCKQCNHPLTPRQKRRRNKFCSSKCYNMSRQKLVTLICPKCKIPFDVLRYEARNGRVFCSPECRQATHNVKLICQYCRQQFGVKSKYADQKFCSPECFVASHYSTTTCQYCGKHFDAKMSEIRAGRKYCSRECKDAAQRKRIMLVCQYCKKQFEAQQGEKHKGRKFCSRECFIAMHRPIILMCRHCGKSFHALPGEIKKGRKFCSRKCFTATHRAAFTCQYCHKSFHVSSTKAKIAKYCSRKCRDAIRKRQVRLVCHVCKMPFYVKQSRAHIRKHCSQKCRDAPRNVVLICLYCNSPFSVPRSMEEQRKYCSLTCAYAHQRGPNSPIWKGGNRPNSYRGPNWQCIRNRARKRAQCHCEICGVSEIALAYQLDAHHIIPFKSFNYIPGENETYLQANVLENLVACCRSCHRKIEPS